MGSKTSEYFINPSFEGERPTSEEFKEQKEITNDAEKEISHANRTEAPTRILLALVIIKCLISLLVLLITILTFGKIGDGLDCAVNEGQCELVYKLIHIGVRTFKMYVI